jgi:hypothetical protein
MKKLSVLFSFAIVFSFLMSSCDEACISGALAAISETSMPDTSNVNERVNIDVTYQLINGCGRFEDFDITNGANDKELLVKVDAIYDGCICTEAIVTETKTLDYTPSEAGTYIFNFYDSETTFKSDTLIVQ